MNMYFVLLLLFITHVTGNPDLFKYFNSVPIRNVPKYKQPHMNEVAFLGDSTMFQISREYFTIKTLTCTEISVRCSLTEWLTGEKIVKEQWIKPGPNEGPTDYGYDHPGCSDCSGCEAKQCGRNVYFPIEFARDVELQTEEHQTTQSLVGAYIQTHPFKMCVVSAGIHDMRIPRLVNNPQLYVENVWYFVQQLEGCQKIVWVLTSSTRDNTKYPQVNKRIKLWNRLIQEDSRISGRVFFFLDAYTLSTKFRHKDNVHLETAYSKTVASLLNGFEF